MSQCDKTDEVINEILESIDSNQRSIDQRMDENIAPNDPDTKKRRSAWKKFRDRLNNEEYGTNPSEKLLNKKFLELYKGKNGEQALLAGKIEELLAQSDIRSFVFLDYLKKDMLAHDVWKMTKVDSEGRPVLESLPWKYLQSLYHRLWNFGQEVDWDSKRMRRWNISFGRPSNLIWKDSSGGFAIMENAVAQYAATIYRSSHQFLNSNGKRFNKRGEPYGMNDVYQWAGEIAELLGEGARQREIDKKGGLGNVQSHFVKFMTMYLNGWISLNHTTGEFSIATRYRSLGDTFKRAVTYKGQIGQIVDQLEGGLFDLKLENGALIKNVNQHDFSYRGGKDYVFGWTDLITLESYDEAKHGEAFFEKKEFNMPLPIKDFLEDHINMTPEMTKRMNELFVMVKGSYNEQGKPSFRGIHQEVYTWFNGQRDDNGNFIKKNGKEVYIGVMEESTRAINTAALKWFVDENGNPYDRRLVEQGLRALWDEKYVPGPDVPAHLIGITDKLKIFTEFVLFETLFWDTMPMQHKDSFPVQFHLKKLPFQFDKLENRLRQELDRVQRNKSKATTNKRSFDLTIETLEGALEHAAWAQGRFNMLEEDTITDTKIVSRKKSVHAKHISNVFDPMEMRTDADLYPGYLTNLAKIPARNHMIASYMDAIRIIDRDKRLNPEAVKQAVTSLYHGTTGHPETRALVFGVDLSPNAISQKLGKLHINVPSPIIEANFKILNRYFTAILLNKYATAAGNSSQAVEKLMVFGFDTLMEMQNYWTAYKNDPGLQTLLQKADVAAFTDYFSQNMIGEMRALEESRNQVVPALAAMIRYKKDVESGKDEDAAFKIMKREVALFMRTEIDKGDVPTLTELTQRKKAMNRNTRLERVNKMANWAITQEYDPAPPMPGSRFIKLKIKIGRAFKYIAQHKRDMAGLPTLASTEAATKSLSWIIKAELHRRMMGYEVPLHKLEPEIAFLQKQLIMNKALDSNGRKAVKEKLKMLKKQRLEYLDFGESGTRTLDFDLIRALLPESGRTSSSKFFGLFSDFAKQRIAMEGDKALNDYRGNLPMGVPPDEVSTKDHIYAFFKTMHDLGKGMLPEYIWNAIHGGKYIPTGVRQTTDKASATLQRMGGIWAWTVAYDLMLGFGIGKIPFVSNVTQKILRKLDKSHQLGKANSNAASLFLSLPILFAISLWGDDDDEIDENELFDFFLFSAPMIGVGGGTVANAMMWLAGQVVDAIDARIYGRKVIKTITPAEIFPVVEETAEPVIEYIEEEF